MRAHRTVALRIHRACTLAVLSLGLVAYACGQVESDGGGTVAERRLQDIVSAEQAFYDAYNRNPENFSQGDLERHLLSHISAYTSYLKDNPEDVDALILYGKLLRRAGEEDVAFQAFLKADSLNPRLAVVKQQIGTYLAEQEEPKAALPFYLQAIDLEPGTAIYHFQLGKLLMVFREELVADEVMTHDGIDRQMLEAYKRAAELEPDDFELQLRYCETFYDLKTKDWKGAYVAWTRLRQQQTDPIRFQIVDLHRAKVLTELKRYDDARLLLDSIDAENLQYSKDLVLAEIRKSAQ